MIRVPQKYKKSISTELKRFVPIIKGLVQKGKEGTEEDARIVLNDMLADVLGYDKYNELKTEQRDKNHKLDYAVKIQGGSGRRKEKLDFIIEAKAAHIQLAQTHVDQTLNYCLGLGTDYFIVTNVQCWQLYEVQKKKGTPEAHLLHEVDFSKDSDFEILAELFYPFSKASFVDDDWDKLAEHRKATSSSDIVAIILCDKMVKGLSKMLKDVHDIKVPEETLKHILETKVIREAEVRAVNRNLLKKLNTVDEKKPKEVEPVVEEKSEAPNSNVLPLEHSEGPPVIPSILHKVG